MDELFITQIPVAYAETLPSSGRREVRRVCKDKICCEFSMRYVKYDVGKDRLRYTYKVTAFAGKEKFIDEQSKEIYCSVVACTSDDTSSCGKRFQPSDKLASSVRFKEIKINMIVELETTENDYLVMPTNVDFAILPLGPRQFSFARSDVYQMNE